MLTAADPWHVSEYTYRRLTKLERWHVAAWYRDWLSRQKLAQGMQHDLGYRPLSGPRVVARRAFLFGTWSAWQVVILPPLFVAASTFSLIRLGDDSRSAVIVIAVGLVIGVVALAGWGCRALQIRRHLAGPASSQPESAGVEDSQRLELSRLEIVRDDLQPLDRRTKVVRWVGALACVAVAEAPLLTLGPRSVTFTARAEYALLVGVIGQEILWRFWKQTSQAHQAFMWTTAADDAAKV
jgi:hypothetical protein